MAWRLNQRDCYQKRVAKVTMSLIEFHPHQLALVGYSNSGKTTLMEKLLKRFKEQGFHVGVLKHDAHQLNLDREDKDSYRFWEAGASSLLVHNQEESFYRSPSNSIHQHSYFSNCDFVLIEGHKQSSFPKIVLLDEETNIWDDLNPESQIQALAIVGPGSSNPLSANLPYFQRDDVSKISEFILKQLMKTAYSTELKGLVLTGGQSSRMGKDKSQLHYHGQAQHTWTHQLLSQTGIETYLSCRSDQSFPEPCIYDQLLNQGPLGGLLSAFLQFSKTAFLCVGIDQPKLSLEGLKYLIEHRNPLKQATVYVDPNTEHLDPLYCIYEPSFKAPAFQALGLGNLSPKKLLESLNIERVVIQNPGELINCNTPEEHQALMSSSYET